MNVTESVVDVDAGRVLLAYDTHPGAEDRLAVFWHHGTPNIGAPPKPLFAAAERLGLRWVSYDRPGYGRSTPAPGRDIASAATDAAMVADTLGIDEFAVVGHSGGAPHALACAALLPERVTCAVSLAGLAPFTADGLDWFGGMAASGVASLAAAAEGREAKEAFESSEVEYDPEFTERDRDALSGPWAWLHEVVGPALGHGPGPLIDDDLAYVNPWGFDPQEITAPVLLLHGEVDRVVPSAHSQWLSRRMQQAEIRLLPEDGHISVLGEGVPALEWLAARGA